MKDHLPEGLRERLKFDGAGLIAAVIQDHENDDVLMVGYMNDVALARTLTSGRVWFWFGGGRGRREDRVPSHDFPGHLVDRLDVALDHLDRRIRQHFTGGDRDMCAFGLQLAARLLIYSHRPLQTCRLRRQLQHLLQMLLQ